MFIRTGVQKCEPFPTHITSLSPKWVYSDKINLIEYSLNNKEYIIRFQRLLLHASFTFCFRNTFGLFFVRADNSLTLAKNKKNMTIYIRLNPPRMIQSEPIYESCFAQCFRAREIGICLCGDNHCHGYNQ